MPLGKILFGVIDPTQSQIAPVRRLVDVRSGHVVGIRNNERAAPGRASYRDFLIFTHTLQRLERGCVLSFGSAIMAPEIYLKALSMVRNVARQEGRRIVNFTTAVFDIWPIRGDFHKVLDKSDPGYYFRPHKTILVRTVADGGESFYFEGDHRATLPALRKKLTATAAP